MLRSEYAKRAIVLHWLIAGLLAFQIGLGFAFEAQPRGPGLFAAYQLHKSIGILILFLSVARLGLRFANPPVAHKTDEAWSLFAAGVVHASFYGIMILGPVTGWLIVSTARINVPTLLFGTIPWPHLPVGMGWHAPAQLLHSILAWSAIVLFVLHVAGALRHQFAKSDALLERMIPIRLDTRAKAGFAAGIAIAGIILLGAFGNGLRLAGPPPHSNSSAQVGPFAASSNGLSRPAPESIDPTESAATEQLQQPTASEDANSDSEAGKAALAGWNINSGGRLGFSADWNGTAIHGTFARWTGKILFSPDDLAGSNISVVIDLGSASTADEQRDEMLKGESFFDTAAHPRAEFHALAISHQGGDRYRIAGTLSLHGQSRPVVLDVCIKIDGDRATVSGSTKLNRTRFGVGSGEWTATDQVAADVGVNFAFSAKRN